MPLTAVVEAEDGESVRLGTAWVRKTDLMAPADAPNYFSEKILNHPNSAIYRKKRGLAWQLLSEFDKAVSDYTEAIRLDPQDSYSHEFRSRAWAAKREMDRAIDDICEAIRLGPPRPMIYNMRGTLWLIKREEDRAVADFSEAIRLDPRNVTHYHRRAAARLLKKDAYEAIQDCTRAIELAPSNADSHGIRAVMLYSGGDLNGAVRDFTEAIRLDSKNPNYSFQLAWILATSEDASIRNGAKAVEYATQACELSNWQDTKHLRVLAAAYAENGDFLAALKWHQKAIDLTADEKEKADLRTFLDHYKSGEPWRIPTP